MGFTSRAKLASWAVEQSVRHYLERNPEAMVNEVLADARGTLAMVGLTMSERNRREALDNIRLYGHECECPNLTWQTQT